MEGQKTFLAFYGVSDHSANTTFWTMVKLLLTPAFPCILLDSSVSTILCWQQRREARKHSNLLGSEKHSFYSPHLPKHFSLLKSEFFLSNDGWVPVWSFLPNAVCKLCFLSFPLCDCLPIFCSPMFSGLRLQRLSVPFPYIQRMKQSLSAFLQN